MIFPLLVLFGLLSLLVAIACFKRTTSPMHRIFISLYFLNFFLGHVILLSYKLIFKPELQILLSDERLLDQNVHINFILMLNITQFFAICSGSILYGCFKGSSAKESPVTFPKSVTDALVILTCIGWIGNIGAVAGNQNLLSAFHPFELIGTAWLVSGFRLTQIKMWLVYAFAISHFIWAVFLYHSKAEAFLILVAFAIRVSHQPGRVNFRSIWALAVAGLILFPLIQIQKGIFTVSKVEILLNSQGEKHAWVKSLGVGFLQRFDGADSITDAITAGSGSWYSAIEYGKILFSKFVPNLSFLVGDYFGEETSTSLSLGKLWNNQMRPITIKNVTYNIPVSYGPLAEGYAISGIFLAVALCLIFGATLHAFSNFSYGRSLFSTTCGLYFMSHLENIQNSVGSTFLMFPKMIQCYVLLRICLLLTSRKEYAVRSIL